MKTHHHRVVARAALVAATLALPIIGSSTDAGALRVPPAVSEIGHGPDGLELDPFGPTDREYEVDAHAPWSPDEWDGASFTKDQPDLTTLPTVHTVYMHPIDQPNRIEQFAAMFQADARASSELLNDLYGRGVRFDERSGAGGTNYLDITVVPSVMTSVQLGLPQLQFFNVQAELFRAGLNKPNKKYAVWLDAPSAFCGQAMLWGDTYRDAQNANEQSSVAIVYRPRPPVDANGGFCRGATLLHELGHGMGALQDIAPNAFDGAHCDDSAEDVMCYAPPAIEDTGGPAFDYNNDDYWDPVANPVLGSTKKLPWWTVNLSRFICPTSGCANPNKNPGY